MSASKAATESKSNVNRMSRWIILRLQLMASWKRLWVNWAIFSRNPLALFGVFLIVLFALMAIIHPILMATVWSPAIYSPITGFDIAYAPHPSLPSVDHLLGTDPLGKDVLSLLLASTAPTFTMGIAAALTTALFGTIMGAITAYYGGRFLDSILSHVSDAALLLPAPILMIVIGLRFRDLLPYQFGLIYGFMVGISSAAIVLRSHGLTIMARPFIEASRVAGAGSWYVMRKHLIPHMLPLAFLYMMLAVTGAVVADGFISFFGFSRVANNWGSMIYSAFVYSTALGTGIPWHMLIPPALAISLFAAAFYFVSRGLQEVSDPRIRGEENLERAGYYRDLAKEAE